MNEHTKWFAAALAVVAAVALAACDQERAAPAAEPVAARQADWGWVDVFAGPFAPTEVAEQPPAEVEPPAPPPTTEPPPPPPTPVTEADLMNMELPAGTCLWEPEAPCRLVDGRVALEDGPFSSSVEVHSTLIGDLDGNGVDDGVAVLLRVDGNAASFVLLALLDGGAQVAVPYEGEGSFGEEPVAELDGSRIITRSAVYQDGDPPCCFSGEVIEVLEYRDGSFSAVETVMHSAVGVVTEAVEAANRGDRARVAQLVVADLVDGWMGLPEAYGPIVVPDPVVLEGFSSPGWGVVIASNDGFGFIATVERSTDGVWAVTDLDTTGG